MYFIDMYDKVMCAVVASALLCIPGDSCIGSQGSKLGWSCGPSLPNLLSDHQIVICGGPVVYWKTHHKKNVSLNIWYMQELFKCLVQEKVKFCSMFRLTKKY